MRRKVELVGGHFDGMKTFVDLDADAVVLIDPEDKPVIYRKRPGTKTTFDWVKDEG